MNAEENTFKFLDKLSNNYNNEREHLINMFTTNEQISDMLDNIYKYDNIIHVSKHVEEFKKLFKNYDFSPIQQLFDKLSSNLGINKIHWNNKLMNHELERIGYGEDEILSKEEYDKVALAYDISNRMANYDVYGLSNKSINDYSINLLWINLMPQSLELNKYIFDTHIEKRFVETISKWRDLNPRITINLWYDSALTIEETLKNTIQLLDEYYINFMDVRTIPNIPHLVYKSLHPLTPLYYRVDLAKVLLTDYLTNPEYSKNKYVVYSDIDVKPMDSNRLFDFITIKNLEKYGYVFNTVRPSGFENSFFIFDSDSKSSRINEHIIRNVENDFEIMVFNAKNDPLHFDSSYLYPQYDSTVIYDKQYPLVFTAFGERKNDDRPRKPVNVPPSQFLFGPSFKDHRSETFIFNARGNIKMDHDNNTRYNKLFAFEPAPL